MTETWSFQDQYFVPHTNEALPFVLSTIASWALENPDKMNSSEGSNFKRVDYGQVFPELLKKLANHYFSKQKEILVKISQIIDKYGETDENLGLGYVKEKEYLETCVQNMIEKFDYQEESALEAISFLLKSKYSS